ncbi:NADH:flavin oxidoreductase [Pontibacillus salicampi]|uniref:NADH:flavin oxidoreductase n=1 Tax=Pontibacillus salicampi TaxID=1449801 RepID=A0ABV6LQX3_9BACI
MSNNFETLFDKVTVHNTSFDNRYIVAPMTRVSANEDGTANERMQRYYERYAKGGFGAIISEGVYIDDAHSQGYNNQPGMVTDNHVAAWKPIVDKVHEYNTKMIAQLMHAGAQVQGNAYTDVSIAPSAVAPKGEQLGFYGGSGPFPTPKKMTKADIQSVIHSFVSAAQQAKEAGFDGVEIHGANGYLLDEFITDYMNNRDDEYGGSLEKGLRIIQEIIRSVREQVGEEYIVGIRLSQGKVADQSYRWPNGEEAAKLIFGTIGSEAIDYIHVTDGDGTAPGFGADTLSMSQAAKHYGKKPVIANGKLGSPEQAHKAVQEEEADFISLGTGALANPDAPHRVKNGTEMNDFDAEAILFPEAYIKDMELNAYLK